MCSVYTIIVTFWVFLFYDAHFNNPCVNDLSLHNMNGVRREKASCITLKTSLDHFNHFESIFLKQKAHKIKPSFFPPVDIFHQRDLVFLKNWFMKFPVKLVIILHEFFITICIALAYSGKHTFQASHNWHILMSFWEKSFLRVPQERVIKDLLNSLVCVEMG